MKEILLVFIVVQGKNNFRNLVRWLNYEEKKIRRNYEKMLNLSEFTQFLVENYEKKKS